MKARLLAVICAMAFITSIASALDYKDITFYAPFDGSFEPVIAKGDPAPQFGAKKPGFGEGIIGQALQAGDPGVTLSYEVKDNFPDLAGTLAVWIKPVNWGPGETIGMQPYMSVQDRWYFAYSNISVLNVFQWSWLKAPGWWGVQQYPPGSPAKDAWRHYAFTWGDGKLIMYYNGKYLLHRDGDRDLKEFREWAPQGMRFFFTDKNEAPNMTGYDEFMLFNRPLSAVEVMSVYRKGLRALRKLPAPTLRIAKAEAAPVIDGKIRGGEWDSAAGATGFVDRPFGNMTKKDIHAKLSYDKNNLYLLVVAESSGTKESNFVEVWFAQDKKAAAEHVYHFKATLAGSKSNAVGDDAKWEGRWSAACGTTGRSDFAEFAIPLKTIGLEGAPPKKLSLNILKSWSKGYGEWATLADTTVAPEALSKASTFATIELAGDEPVADIASFGKAHYAALDLRGSLINPSATSRKINMTVRMQPTDLKEIVEDGATGWVGTKTWSGTVVSADRELQAKKGVTRADVAKSFYDTDINSVLIKIEDEKGAVLYEQQAPFVCTPPIMIESRTYPKHNRVDVIADVSEYREAAFGELAAALVFTDKKGAKVGKTEIKKFTAPKNTASFELSKLPVGDITVTATLSKIGGDTISDATTSFARLGELPWMNTKIGLDSIVIEPFKPLKVDGQTVSLWNRKYVWKDSLFPVEIHSNGKQLLSGPIEMFTGEAPTGRPNKAAVTIKSASEAVVELEAKSAIGGVPVTARTTIEYDGMILINLVFEPESATSLPQCAMTMPMKTECAWLYNYVRGGGAVAETENRIGAMNGDKSFEWLTDFWLGTPDEGLMWFSVDPENWRLKGNPTPLNVKLEGNVTRLTATLAKSQYALAGPTALRFGFFGTPAKPMRRNWRFYRCYRDWGYRWYGPLMNSNNHIGAMDPGWPDYFKKNSRPGYCYVPYVAAPLMNLAEPEMPYYRWEWCTEPWSIMGSDDPEMPGEKRHLSVCFGSDWQDFAVYHLTKITEAANVGDGFYFDLATPSTCANKLHGHGYTDEEGNWVGSHNMLDFRRFYKRIAVMLSQHKKNWQDYLIFLNQQAHFQLPALSFASLGWNGEQYSSAAMLTRDYTQLMTAEACLANFYGKQFGYPLCWYVCFFDRNDQPPINEGDINTLLCLGLINGIQDQTISGNLGGKEPADYLRKVLDRAESFPLSEEKADFFGWWENAALVTQSPQNNKLKCSLWKTKAEGRILMMLGNANGDKSKPAATTITLRKEALGIPGDVTATDWWTKEPVPLKDSSFTVTVEGSSWRMIAVEPKQS